MSEILALVKMNNEEALVFKEEIVFNYEKHGNIIIGVDSTGLLIQCYKYDRPSPGFYAFGGNKFTLTMIDGTIIECYGQWWDGGYKEAEKILGSNLINVAYNTKDNLKDCYVYYGATAIEKKLGHLKNEYKKEKGLKVFEYREYEKLIK